MWPCGHVSPCQLLDKGSGGAWPWMAGLSLCHTQLPRSQIRSQNFSDRWVPSIGWQMTKQVQYGTGYFGIWCFLDLLQNCITYILHYIILHLLNIYIYIYVQFSPLVSHGISPGNPGVFTFFWPFPLSKPPGQDCRRAHGAAWVPLVPLATKGLDDLFGDRGFQQKRHFFWGENIYLLGTVQDFYVGKKS